MREVLRNQSYRWRGPALADSIAFVMAVAGALLILGAIVIGM